MEDKLESPSHIASEEPESKKLKMSTTTSDDEDPSAGGNTTATDVSTDKKTRYKRRKIAIFFAYCGVGYQGMQKNPGAKTIEADLEEALFLSGAVPEQDRGNSKRYDWARSARTDKGVSAVGQVVSGRFYIDPPGFVERLNSNLASQIRIFGFKRVTASFNAKKFCDRRRYVYLIPVFALDPNSHRDRESVLASLGSGNVLVKCVECSNRGRKIPDEMLKRISERKMLESESGISLNHIDTEVDSKEAETPVHCDNSSFEPIKESKEIEAFLGEIQCTNFDSALLDDSKGEVEEEKLNQYDEAAKIITSFCYGEEEKEKFNRILTNYVGSHNFHNFTTRTKAEDPAAQRYIISFDANDIVTVEGIDFVKCEVVGQSFMLHQIRKMIGLAVAIMRNCAPESLITTALQRSVNITVPTAPEVGLFLDECFFTSYNKKWKDSHEEVSMQAFKEEAESFKMKQIYTHIASTEHKEGSVALWLHSLNHRNYPDLCTVDNANTNGETNSIVENCDSVATGD